MRGARPFMPGAPLRSGIIPAYAGALDVAESDIEDLRIIPAYARSTNLFNLMAGI